MFKNKFSFLLFVFFSSVCLQSMNAQLSKKHFIPPLTYAEKGNANPEDQYFYISTPSNKNVSFSIKQVGFPENNITRIVSSATPQKIFIANGDSQLFVDSNQTSVVHADKGYIIEADDVIYVSIRVLAGGGAQAGALVSKGVSALGTTFRAGMFTNENPQTNYLNFISVMATENNTKVSFDDLPTGIQIKNYTGTLPITNILLNEGESYIIATNASENIINKGALIGTLITSDKPIVTNIGSANGSFHNGNGRDYGIDQIVGLDKIGREYIFVKGDGSNGWENVLIVAHEDNTTIKINGNGVAKTINAGKYFVIEGHNFNGNGNMYVQTSKPIFAYQGIGANTSEANQGLFFVPPLSCENRGKVDNIPNIENIGGTNFTGGVTIVTNTGATVKINAQPITNFTALGPFIVAGNTNYVTYKVTNLTGNISIESSGELYCAYFNQNGAASSGSFYSGFPSAPEINFDATVISLGNCIPNITLKAANTGLFDSFEWFFDDENGGGFMATGIKTPDFKPNLPGKYKLKATINCTMAQFESVEVPVSICPDDYDNDGIIDNLDVDIDNDGILNCEESIGNAILNLTNNTNPSILFKDGNLSNSIASGSYTQSNSSGLDNIFSGDNLGNFTSTLNIANTSNAAYQINFSEKINLKFTQDINLDHTVSEGEFFIIKIGPNNKNITLLDPDDQLLIDTNFDDIYETGITKTSTSEIRFKYRANLSGIDATFVFVANKVEQIIFEHNSNALTSIATFNANIQLTCFSLDSDGDGIENVFDLDSDNDGIPDFYESTAQSVTLTNTSTNLDGLDALFDTVTTNQDTDNDAIPNYLDVDADNDGIYDVVEAGYAYLDNNNDGIIDISSSLTVGKNGLLDALETAPDSGVLNNPIRNSDSASEVIANRDLFFDFADLDSDGDDCFDVIEAGFTGNGSGLLNATPFLVYYNGKVKNYLDGYTTPNSAYLNSSPIIITKFEDRIFCEEDTNEIEIETNAATFQWQLSSDNGVTFIDISENKTIDGTIFNNVNSSKLKFTNASINFNNYQFKVVLGMTAGNICPKTTDAIILTINPKPIILNNLVLLKQCADNPNENTIVNLTEAEISISDNARDSFTYFETEANALAGTPEITDKEHYLVTAGFAEAWVRTTSEFSCYTISKIEATASFAGNVAYDKTFEECDDFLDEAGNNSIDNSDSDGITNFNFSIAAQEISDTFPMSIRGDIQVLFYETTTNRDASINAISDISNHRNNKENTFAPFQTIYIKIKNKNNNDCEGVGKLFLKTNTIPQFTVKGEAPDEPILICAKNIPYTLEALGPADTYDYVWRDNDGNKIGGNTQNISISEGGSYTVTANSRDSKICSKTRTIVVEKSNFETLNESFVTITDDTSSINSNLSIQIDIPINPSINEEFQYAIENESGTSIHPFQDSNIFNDIEGGVYTILVENKNGCGSSELTVSVIQYPKFFTPNGDGINDTWLVKGANSTFYTTTNINIFNRYGKLIAEVPIDGRGWDGTFKGKIVSSDDYWFNVQLTPLDTTKPTRNKKGNFSLIRK